jgi:S-adenosylmethionine:tRNA ribosyltransferase-isomerase
LTGESARAEGAEPRFAVDGVDFPAVPEELIAQSPLERRDDARLLVVDRAAGSLRHDVFRSVETLFRPGDVLVLNDTCVFPARLTGRKPTGGRVKVLLLGRADGEAERWLALLTPSLRPGAWVAFDGGLAATVAGARESGEFELDFDRPVAPLLPALGRMPLPPYIRRPDAESAKWEPIDRVYYQTVYSEPSALFHSTADPAAGRSAPLSGNGTKSPGSVAAPTAGLHFTAELLDRIRARGVVVAPLRLDVGWGTFRPVRAADYRDHRMLPEPFRVPAETAAAVNAARAAGRRVWAVGTTAVRALESAAGADGAVAAGPGSASIYIHPGHRFRAVDALITNLHLPGHTPLLLAAAFAGAPLLRRAYDEALRERYRFFSYGDAMLLL